MQENVDPLQTEQILLPLQVMVDSVVTPDNLKYEREEIEGSISTKPAPKIFRNVSEMIELQLVTTFLVHISHGRQDKAEAQLRKNLNLIEARGDFEDCAGRRFKQVTGLQYAVWALDWHMWQMILNCIPYGEADRRNQIIREQIIDGLNRRGIDVEGPGEYTRHKLSWGNLVTAYTKCQQACTASDWVRAKNIWCKEVGKAQLWLPAHVINEYNHPNRKFNPCPDFTAVSLATRADRQGVDSWKGGPAGQSKLGESFAWARGAGAEPWPVGELWEGHGYCVIGMYQSYDDEYAVRSLYNTREMQRTRLVLTSMLASRPISPRATTLSRDFSSYSFTASPASLGVTNQTIIFSAPATPQDSSIIKMLDEFLKHVGFGEQDEAEDMLKKDNYLTLEAGDLTDCAKREFKQITAFQYSLWALDFHMWTMLLKYLPKEEASKQVKGLKNGDWVQIQGHHADWQNLIEALDMYIKNYRFWSVEQCCKHWRQQVGGAQLLLPAHVINEYSHPSRSFYPCPEWEGYSEEPLPRTGVNNWQQSDNGQYILGKSFAWGRGAMPARFCNIRGGREWAERMYFVDLTAINKLFRRRIEQATLAKLIYYDPDSQHTLLFSSLNITDASAPTMPISKKSILFPQIQSQIAVFFKHVGYGEQNEAEERLKANQNLAIVHGDLTDCSQRTWQNITAYQYAVLVLDYHMWSMIQRYMTNEEIRTQLEELCSIATLNDEVGWIIKSTLFTKWPAVRWASLIAVLEIYIKKYQFCNDKQCHSYWCQQVGGAQLLLPAHVINEYSHPSRSFYPCPKWGDSEATLPRMGVHDWQQPDNGQFILGKNFAWCRSEWSTHEQLYTLLMQLEMQWDDDAWRDRVAINELLRARVDQAKKLLYTNTSKNQNNSQKLAI